MIRFEPAPEPPDFDERVRKPGNAWLAQNPPPKRPKDFWSPVKPALADAFRGLCAYTAMHVVPGTVDHYRSCRNNRELAYEWSNYRFACEWANSVKQAADDQVLDPFEVVEDWFEILLPSLQLVLTDAVPQSFRGRAEFTLARMRLRDGEQVIRQRRAWYELYEEGALTLDGLERRAPLIARAIRKQLTAR